jgi:hypothetical protein
MGVERKSTRDKGKGRRRPARGHPGNRQVAHKVAIPHNLPPSGMTPCVAGCRGDIESNQRAFIAVHFNPAIPQEHQSNATR